MPSQKYISIFGARQNNLKDINLTIPRNKLIVITGVSGSGKSSLAFDTIYAEGQRCYVESLSSYARQFLDIMQKPNVDRIEGLSPAISINQKNTGSNSRSTVATLTKIYDYIKLFFSHIGVPFSPHTGLPITSQSISNMIDELMKLPIKTKIYILSPIIKNRKGEFCKELLDLQKKGFHRLKIDGNFYEIFNIPVLKKNSIHDIDVVIDRIIIDTDSKDRLSDSLQTSLFLSNGLTIIEFPDDPLSNKKSIEKSIYNSKNDTHKRILFSERFSCPVSGFSIDSIEPRLFSFNNPFGACPSCQGSGIFKSIDPNAIISTLNLKSKNKKLFSQLYSSNINFDKIIKYLEEKYNLNFSEQWELLSEKARDIILYGEHPLKKLSFNEKNSLFFEGIVSNMEKRFKDNHSYKVRKELENYMSSKTCPSCHGYRLKQQALSVKIGGIHIGQVLEMSISDADIWFQNIRKTLTNKEKHITNRISKEIRERFLFLKKIGLEYLTLNRNSITLSGGENQRIRLSSQIGSYLTGIIYVLDEPSIGLHPRDNMQLINMLKILRDLGNTVIVIEHDRDTILSSDYIIDIGPGSGIYGGNVVASGTPEDIIKSPNSITGKYLSNKTQTLQLIENENYDQTKKFLKIIGARANNLKNITAEIPLGKLTCVTGVSGCGKSTFLIDILFNAASKYLMGNHCISDEYEKIEGLEFLDKVINVNQFPVGRTPRSNPITYIGAFVLIREWFSNLPTSKIRGYSSSRFSLNIKGGRCESCEGDGTMKIKMYFLPDIYVTCDACFGKRYNRETLEILFKGKSISDVLDMTVDEALNYFSFIPVLYNKLNSLKEVGLSYITIGQKLTTLSGGEVQRIKLAKELSKKATGRTLYILDEPTTGLHFNEVLNLVSILRNLVKQGNTVIIIEHNLEIIKTSDWIIDLGPEGGDRGGEVIASCRPLELINKEFSYTGKFLKNFIRNNYFNIKNVS